MEVVVAEGVAEAEAAGIGDILGMKTSSSNERQLGCTLLLLPRTVLTTLHHHSNLLMALLRIIKVAITSSNLVFQRVGV